MALAAALLGAVGVSFGGWAAAVEEDTLNGAASLDPLVIVSNGKEHLFQVELADTPEVRERGLMFRPSLPRDQGMLFVFDRTAPVTMWMKDTRLTLDMLFIASDGRVTKIVERATPFSRRPITSRRPVRAVLEILGGTVARLDLRVGAVVMHPVFGNGHSAARSPAARQEDTLARKTE